MTGTPNGSPAEQILALSDPDGISAYIAECTRKRELSAVMRKLNTDAKSGEGHVRQKALEALNRLGFPTE